MKRRQFLSMFGAAAAAPLMPALGSAAGYTRTTYELAIAHAKKYPLVSVGGLSKRIGIATPQAEAIIKQMSSEGLLGILNPTRPGTVKATSKICTKDVWGLRRTSEPRAVQADKAQAQDRRSSAEPNISAMFAHLHKLSTSCGMTLSPRCFSGVHA